MDGATERDKVQAEVIDFLSKPGSFPDAGDDAPIRIETHAALVFLAGSRAYKLKRAVKLPYLDFSSLEKRRAALERELKLNSRTTPELYLSLLPVTRGTGAEPRIGGPGEVLDWVLVMRRFDQDALFEALASKGRLEPKHVAALAGLVEHFHRTAPRVADAGFPDHISHVACDLEAVLCGPEAETLGLRLKPYLSRLRAEAGNQQTLMSIREREGFVRECHGDLHLRNIVLWEGSPRLFDAVEFDQHLANIDVFYDLAFLLMDLWRRGMEQHANAILNHYLARAAISEIEGLALLPLFMSVRAAIRAMTGVHALAHRPPAEHDRALTEIQRYSDLASRLIDRKPPVLAAIGGVSGTGKTSAAREAAPFIGAAPGALHLRTDTERKVMEGVPFDHPLPSEFYSADMRDEVYRRVFKKAEVALDAGHSVIADAVFPEEASRARLCELAHRTGAVFWGFWLEADAQTVTSRLAARRGDASDADSGIAQAQLNTVAVPADWVKIDASGTIESAVSSILQKLRS